MHETCNKCGGNGESKEFGVRCRKCSGSGRIATENEDREDVYTEETERFDE